ncbi:MAG: TonB-dependent receptor [Pseudomonadota bacterium]
MSAPIYAQSQPAPGSQTQVFLPDFFDRFAPQTALDMLVQVPGFEIEGDDDGSRGFGQATGNVLINGQRISGKSNGAEDALGRIPAQNVERIEIVDGASLDIPGLSGQVANVIAAADSFGGTWNYQNRFRRRLEPNFGIGEISIAGKRGTVDWTLGFELDNFRNGGRGIENVFDGNGTLIEIRDEEVQPSGNVPEVSASLNWKRTNGDIGNLNASFQIFDFRDRELGFRSPINGVDSIRLFQFTEDEWNTEVSADYEFGLGPGRLKLITLVRAEHSPTVADLEETPVDGTPSFGSIFEQTADELETIGRGEYSWSPKDGRDWQVSLEGAFNSLDAVSSLMERNDQGGLDIVDLDGATTRVEEIRAETNITYGRKLAKRLTSQVSVGVEYSEIAQSGPSGLTRSFTRPKGFISLSWNASDSLDITARAEREVGQLNFFDFVSSVNLNNDNDSFGNPDLVPEQSWTGEVEFEQTLGAYGAATLRIFGERIEDVIDRIPLSPTSDGVGNIGTGNRFGAELNATIRFDKIGLKGVQLEFEGQARRSNVTDPLTGQTRRINRDLVSFVFAELRWDIPSTDLAVSFGYDQFRRARTFRFDETALFVATPGFGFATFEHKDIFGLRGSIEIGNLFNSLDTFERTIFETNRLGPIDFIEDRERDFGPILTIGLSGTF